MIELPAGFPCAAWRGFSFEATSGYALRTERQGAPRSAFFVEPSPTFILGLNWLLTDADVATLEQAYRLQVKTRDALVLDLGPFGTVNAQFVQGPQVQRVTNGFHQVSARFYPETLPVLTPVQYEALTGAPLPGTGPITWPAYLPAPALSSFELAEGQPNRVEPEGPGTRLARQLLSEDRTARQEMSWVLTGDEMRALLCLYARRLCRRPFIQSLPLRGPFIPALVAFNGPMSFVAQGGDVWRAQADADLRPAPVGDLGAPRPSPTARLFLDPGVDFCAAFVEEPVVAPQLSKSMLDPILPFAYEDPRFGGALEREDIERTHSLWEDGFFSYRSVGTALLPYEGGLSAGGPGIRLQGLEADPRGGSPSGERGFIRYAVPRTQPEAFRVWVTGRFIFAGAATGLAQSPGGGIDPAYPYFEYGPFKIQRRSGSNGVSSFFIFVGDDPAEFVTTAVLAGSRQPAALEIEFIREPDDQPDPGATRINLYFHEQLWQTCLIPSTEGTFETLLGIDPVTLESEARFLTYYTREAGAASSNVGANLPIVTSVIWQHYGTEGPIADFARDFRPTFFCCKVPPDPANNAFYSFQSVVPFDGVGLAPFGVYGNLPYVGGLPTTDATGPKGLAINPRLLFQNIVETLPQGSVTGNPRVGPTGQGGGAQDYAAYCVQYYETVGGPTPGTFPIAPTGGSGSFKATVIETKAAPTGTGDPARLVHMPQFNGYAELAGRFDVELAAVVADVQVRREGVSTITVDPITAGAENTVQFNYVVPGRRRVPVQTTGTPDSYYNPGFNQENGPPLLTVPGDLQTPVDTPLAVTGFVVDELEGDVIVAQLAATSGTLTVVLQGAAVIVGGANGSAAVNISGVAADIQATLNTLSYAPAAAYEGSAFVTFVLQDSQFQAVGRVVNIQVGDADPGNARPSIGAVPPGPIGLTVLAGAPEASLLAQPPAAITLVDDSALLDLTITADAGVITLQLQGTAVVTAGASGESSVTIQGTLADLQATLNTAAYREDPGVEGTDQILLRLEDDGGAFYAVYINVDVFVQAPPTEPVPSGPVGYDNWPVSGLYPRIVPFMTFYYEAP